MSTKDQRKERIKTINDQLDLTWDNFTAWANETLGTELTGPDQLGTLTDEQIERLERQLHPSDMVESVPAAMVEVVPSEVAYVPQGQAQPIRLTLESVRDLVAVPTAQGNVPADRDLIHFMQLCAANKLNPWCRDAYLVGYDTKDGPRYSLIVAVQALDKRAELHPEYRGVEWGVVTQGKPLANAEDVAASLRELIQTAQTKEGRAEIQQEIADALGGIRRQKGCVVPVGEKLVGAWARAHRADRDVPCYDELSLGEYSTGKSLWASKPATMICKCARASVLRKAFPSLGGLYIAEEIEREQAGALPAGKARSQQLLEAAGKVS